MGQAPASQDFFSWSLGSQVRPPWHRKDVPRGGHTAIREGRAAQPPQSGFVPLEREEPLEHPEEHPPPGHKHAMQSALSSAECGIRPEEAFQRLLNGELGPSLCGA